jgi:hypothetical protein
MLRKVDYYTSLAQAVARLERDSYEARGTIYDLALAEIVKRLHTAVPPLSQADIDMELLAFREAIRRVEFGDLDDLDWLARRSESATAPSEVAPPVMSPVVAPAAAPPVMPPGAPPVAPPRSQAALQMALSQAMPRVPANAAPAMTPPARYVEPSEDRQKLAVTLRRRSVIRRVARRLAFAVVLIGLAIAGYSYATGQFDFSPLTRLMDRIATSGWRGGQTGAPAQISERVVYHEQGGAEPGSQQFSGKAFWSTRSEPSGRGQERETVLVLDVQIPERNFSLAMSMRRDAAEGAVMSHLIEFKFSGAKDFPIEGITGVMGLSLRSVEGKSGTALTGQSVKVAPGLFLFGLSADQDEVRHNTDLLRTQSQLDIPIAFADGRTGTLAVEKGATGEQVFEAAFNQWSR